MSAKPGKALHLVMYSDLNPAGGGRETWLQYFLPALLETGFFSRIKLYTLPASRAALEEYGPLQRTDSRLEWYRIERSKGPLALDFRRQVRRELKFGLGEDDLILSVGAIVDSLPVIALGGDAPFVCWLRSLASGEVGARHGFLGGRLAAGIERRALRRANLILNNGGDTKAWYAERYPSEEGKMVVIPNAIPTDRLRDIGDPDMSRRPIKIAFIGRLAASKGLMTFLESVNLTEPSLPFEFHVWGEGPLEPDVRATRCLYHGSVARIDIPKVLEQCQVVVHLSVVGKGISGGVSHGLLEGLAAGRVVIAFRNNAYTQVVQEDEAILVEEGNALELARAYEKSLSLGSKTVGEMAAQGRIIAGRYSVSSHVQKFVHVVEGLFRR